MLNFFGLELQEQTSTIVSDGWRNGLRNIKDNKHNLLRITRILQCLRETGMLKWQLPFIKALLPHTFSGLSVTFRKQELDPIVLDELNVIEGEIDTELDLELGTEHVIPSGTERCIVLPLGLVDARVWVAHTP